MILSISSQPTASKSVPKLVTTSFPRFESHRASEQLLFDDDGGEKGGHLQQHSFPPCSFFWPRIFVYVLINYVETCASLMQEYHP